MSKDKIIELSEEKLNKLSELIDGYQTGKITSAQLKSFRVPFGIYEQREDDTYMLRIRFTGGDLSAAKLKALAAICKKHEKSAHITTRQEIQIHNVSLEEIVPIYRELLKNGMSCLGGGGNTVRNIIACPLSGLSFESKFDVLPYANALTEYLLPFESSYNMPRKYKIAFSDCDEDCVFASFADLGFFSKRQGAENGFSVYIAGGLGATSAVGFKLLDFIKAGDVFAMALAGKKVFEKYGNRKNRQRARLRFVTDRLGADGLAAAVLAEFEKSKKEIKRKVNIEQSQLSLPKAQEVFPISPAEGFAEWRQDFVLLQKNRGFGIAQINFPLGEIGGREFDLLYKLSEKLKGIGFRLSNRGSIYIFNIKEENLAFVHNFIKSNGLNSEYKPIYGIKSCKGALTCRLGICFSTELSKAIAGKLEDAGYNGRVNINISGCPNACGHHPVAEFGFFGAARRINEHLAPYYKVVYGGVAKEGNAKLAEVIAELPAKKVPEFVVDFYKNEVNTKAEVTAIAEKYSEIPRFEEKPNFYKDWGSQKTFSLREIKPGECGAGVFELIDFEIKEAEHHYHARRYETAFIQICKSLLVLKGVMSDDAREIMREFKKHFMENGWVSRKYVKLFEMVDPPLLKSIIERIKQLYESLDGNLNFTIDKEDTSAATSSSEEGSSEDILDLKGVACPINYVKAKMYLELKPSGSVVDIILDAGEPIQNVPESLRNDGHNVSEPKTAENGRFLITVVKK